MEELLFRFSLEIVILIGVFLIRLGFAYLSSKFEVFEKKELAKSAVCFTEQVYKKRDGLEKFEIAKDKLANLAEERGLFVSKEAAAVFIEEAVLELKQNIIQELGSTNSTP